MTIPTTIRKLLSSVVLNDHVFRAIISSRGFLNKSAAASDFVSNVVLTALRMDTLESNRAVVMAVEQDGNQRVSYSQAGEDIIIDSIFSFMKLKNPSYLDVGAFHPRKFSNTALLYLKGSRGINVEPNPRLFPNFVKERPEDVNLNVGVHKVGGNLDYYEMDADTLNTFSAEEAHRYETEQGHKIVNVQKINVITLDEIIERYAGGRFPDFLNIDAEGVDMDILGSIRFGKDEPKVICVETISYSKYGNGVKDNQMANFLAKHGYELYADTRINSIFVSAFYRQRAR
jgi:FkbM family methyltransferase